MGYKWVSGLEVGVIGLEVRVSVFKAGVSLLEVG